MPADRGSDSYLRSGSQSSLDSNASPRRDAVGPWNNDRILEQELAEHPAQIIDTRASLAPPHHEEE
jgi:hypothetical protein